MNIDQAFPSKYLKSDDISRPIKVFIAGVSMEEIADGETKPVLHFRPNQNLPNHEHPAMVLNLTNSDMIKATYGSDTDAWVGHEVGLWVDPNVRFGNKTVKGLRIKVFQTEPKFEDVAAPVQAVVAQAAVEAAAQTASIQKQASELLADFEQPAVEPDFNDDIPF